MTNPPKFPTAFEDYVYSRPWFPGDPSEPLPQPIPLGDVISKVERTLEWASDTRDLSDSNKEANAIANLQIAASTLIEHLAQMAWNGNGQAGKALLNLGKATSNHLMQAYQERVPTIVERVAYLPEAPGFITRERKALDAAAELMDKIGQGTKNPRPMPKGKKRAWDTEHPKARLVGALFDYISDRRSLISILGAVCPPNHQRLSEIGELPEMSGETAVWKAWRDVSWRIIEDWTNRSPATDKIFNRAPLDELNTNDGSGKNRIRSHHREAWKNLASTWVASG